MDASLIFSYKKKGSRQADWSFKISIILKKHQVVVSDKSIEKN